MSYERANRRIFGGKVGVNGVQGESQMFGHPEGSSGSCGWEIGGDTSSASLGAETFSTVEIAMKRVPYKCDAPDNSPGSFSKLGRIIGSSQVLR